MGTQTTIAELVGLLRELEWDNGYPLKRCAICRQFLGEGHTDDCRLAKALRDWPAGGDIRGEVFPGEICKSVTNQRSENGNATKRRTER